jgi:ankyrin repeat protein
VKSIVGGVMLVAVVCAAVAVLRLPPPAAMVFRQVLDGNHAALAASVRAEPRVVGWRDSLGYTPLHWAAAMCDQDAVDILLEGGADPNARDIRGRTPLHVAAMSQIRSGDALLKSLVARGATVNAADNRGLTPLQFAQTLERSDLAQALLAAGATPAEPAPDTWLAAGPEWRRAPAWSPFPPRRRARRGPGPRRPWARLNWMHSQRAAANGEG